MKAPVNMQSPIKESRVVGSCIEFEDGITEQEVKAILENCNINRNYIIEYNADYMENVLREYSRRRNYGYLQNAPTPLEFRSYKYKRECFRLSNIHK